MNETTDDTREMNFVGVAIQIVVAALFCIGTLPILARLGELSSASAQEFKNYGGDIDAGFSRGMVLAVGFGVLLAIVGYACLLRVPGGGFALVGWAVAIAVCLTALGLLVVGFLGSIGGLGGPGRTPPAAQQFGRSLYYGYPFAIGFSFAAVIVIESMLRNTRHRVARVVRLWLPGVAALAAVVTVVALTVTAFRMHA